MDSQNLFMQSSPLYTSNVHIVDIKYRERICSHPFVVDNFSKLFFNSCILSSKIEDLSK